MQAAWSAERLRRRVGSAVRAARADGPGGGNAFGVGRVDLPAGLLAAAATTGAKVFVFTAETVRHEVRAWVERFPEGDVRVVSAQSLPEWQLPELGAQHLHAETLDQRNWQLKMHGPADVIIDLMPHDVGAQIELWHRTFLHLRPGGHYVVDMAASRASAFTRGWSTWLAELLAAGDPDAPAVAARDREFAASTERFEASRDAIVVQKRQRHYLKLRDAEATRMLAGREPNLRVSELARLAAGELTTKGSIVSHESGVEIVALDRTLKYPELRLRHYEGPLAVVSNALVFAENTILPDSFRHHLERTPRNPRITSISAAFARVADDLVPRAELAGSYYHLDSENSGHYGHLMTEVISRLWGWDTAKKAVPDLKALFRIRFAGERDPELERRVFGAYGIDRADIVWIDKPTRVESLVAATPMWHNQFPHYVHPDIAGVWQRLGVSLRDPDSPRFERIFVSRSGGHANRACRNIAAVEDFFRDRGFEIVYPELLDLGVQAGVFGHARVVAGFGGSAMFNVLFAHDLQTMIVLNHEAYTARNEHLFASVLGCDTHYFWSTPDVPHPKDGWSEAAYYSGWEFDFARNAADLEQLIAQL